MPDISMCSNKTCPKKDTCYRFAATPDDMWQSYGLFSHTTKKPCDAYWPTKED